MLKKIVLVGAIAIASLVSFKIGAGVPSVSVPSIAAACPIGIPINCNPYGCRCEPY